jgi:dihydroorotate dehydrogenase electron transfer subunit
MNYPLVTEIIDVKSENKKIKTIIFEYPIKMNPGQFFMIWIPNVDEIPMSVSYINNNLKGITFKNVGDATESLFNLEVGDKIGLRGPYGRGFDIKGKKILFVGGGTGTAMLAPAIEEAALKNISSSVLIGIKNYNDMFFEDRLKKCGVEYYISTDDGSKGFHGYASDFAKVLLCKTKFSSILTCGPEIMMKKLFDICGNISFQASLERYMKCGVGICGQCCIGNGLRLCVEGPVINGDVLKNIRDFGFYKRDASGRKIYL